MKITARTKMAKLGVVSVLQKVWDKTLIDEVRKFDVPDKIGFIKVTNKNKIKISDVFKMWDIKDNESLINTTSEIFLKNTLVKKALFYIQFRKSERLPMIDFLRLCSYTEDTGKQIADLFDSLKREPKDENKKAIFAKYNGSRFDFIQRFCSIAPAYTYDEAYELPWPTVYMAFRSKVMAEDIDNELAELEMNKLKNNKK